MRRIAKAILVLALVMTAGYMMIQIVKYPERYITTWRYQLYNDIKQGDVTANEYYEKNYVEHGIILWKE